MPQQSPHSSVILSTQNVDYLFAESVMSHVSNCPTSSQLVSNLDNMNNH